jgi:hypothetical protein
LVTIAVPGDPLSPRRRRSSSPRRGARSTDGGSILDFLLGWAVISQWRAGGSASRIIPRGMRGKVNILIIVIQDCPFQSGRFS